MPHRVVVTGFGCVSPLGLSALELWRALLHGSIASQNIRFNPNWAHLGETLDQVSCSVFCPVDSISRRNSPNDRIKFPRAFEFAQLAAAEALKQAKIVDSAGVFIGWGMPGTEEIYDMHSNLTKPVQLRQFL